MPDLCEIQQIMRQALLSQERSLLAALIHAPEDVVEARLDIYRNNIFASLTQVLKDCYPVVCRLVDERFFLYLTDAFIRSHLPQQACLSTYGGQFADFLSEFPACCELAYLPDVARLEWLMHLAVHASDTTPLEPNALRAFAADDTFRLTFQIEPSIGYLASAYPVDRIWLSNQPGADPDMRVSLNDGGVCLEVRRIEDMVGYRQLKPASFTFRAGLARGQWLGEAAAAAMELDPSFDVADALAELFTERSVIALSCV